MAVPSRDWNENTPADTGQVSQGASDMRTIRDDVKDRLEREHVLNTSSSANDGYHLGGSAVLYTTTSAPTTAPDGTALVATAASSADAGRLWKPPGGRIRAYEKTTAAGTTLSWREVAPTVEETVFVATTQTISGDKTFSGASTFSGNTTFTGTITPSNMGSRTYSTDSGLTSDTTLPAGFYYLELIGAGASVEVLDSTSTWRPIGRVGIGTTVTSSTVLVISDGTNFRINYLGSGSYGYNIIDLD